MRIRLAKEHLKWWSVLLLIIGSGSFYFQVLRMPLTFAIMMATVLIWFKFEPQVLRANVITAIAILCLLGCNMIVNIQNGFNTTDFVITLGKLLFTVVLLSNLSFLEFKRIYIKIMVVISVISVVCFLWVDVFALGRLPLQTINYSDAGIVYLTPYYTIGWANGAFGRNAGPFGEPGSYQIFLNFALMYLMLSPSQEKLFAKKENTIYLIILVATVLTTMSTTGLICLAVIILASLVQTRKDYKDSQMAKFKILAIIALIVLYIFESQNGYISYKLSGGGSFAVRSNDTFGGLSLALKNPIVGYGLFQTNKAQILSSVGIGMISNGLVSLMIGVGIPFVILYLVFIYWNLKKNMKYNTLVAVLVILFIFLSMNAEGGALNLIYMINLFAWHGFSNTDIGEVENTK